MEGALGGPHSARLAAKHALQCMSHVRILCCRQSREYVSTQYTRDELIACIAAHHALLTYALQTQQHCIHYRAVQMWLGSKGIGTSVQHRMTKRSSCGMLSMGSA